MGLFEKMVMAGLFSGKRPDPEAKARKREEAGAFMRLALFSRGKRSAKKADKAAAVADAKKQANLDRMLANSRARAAHQAAESAEAEARAAEQRARRATLTPGE